MTQPVPADTKVTEDGAKFAGTAGGTGELALGDGETVGEAVGFAGWVRAGVGVPWPGPTDDWTPVGVTGEVMKRGMVTAAATITAAPPAAAAACPSLRRRGRLLIRSNVPGCGSNGVTRSLSQRSMSSRGSSMGFPQHRAKTGPCV